jgi:excisionase family DNA binding protein
VNAQAIARTKLYEELKAGRLRAVKVGKRTLIPITEAERWLATLAGPGEAA